MNETPASPDWPPRVRLAFSGSRSSKGSGSSKYGAKRTSYNGQVYASGLEASVAQALDALMRLDGHRALVLGYETQQDYVLIPKSPYGRQIIYKADFVVDFRGPHMPVRVILETKGFRTPVYGIKRRLFLEKYGPDLLYEIRKPQEVVTLAEAIAQQWPIPPPIKPPRARKKRSPKTSPS